MTLGFNFFYVLSGHVSIIAIPYRVKVF